MKNYEEIFNESYRRISGADYGDRFFDRFYEIFLSMSADIRRKFDGVDMKSQKQMMRKSFFHLLNLHNTKIASDYIERIAHYHGAQGMGIPVEMFNQWRESVLQSVRELDAPYYNGDVEIAWAMMISPGLEFMRQIASRHGAEGPA